MPKNSSCVEPQVQEAPTINPDMLRCDVYLPTKRRFCKTEKRPGFRYCHTHQAELHPESVEASRRRVPCPVNPNHSVYARDVDRHVKVCPDLRHDTTKLVYFESNLHALQGVKLIGSSNAAAESARDVQEVLTDDQGEDAYVDSAANSSATEAGGDVPPRPAAEQRFTHRNMSVAALADLINRVERLVSTHVKPRIQKSHAVVVASDAETRVTSKHSTQHRGLLDLLQSRCLKGGSWWSAATDPSRVFMELGAGKGGLAYALQQEMMRTPAVASSPSLSRDAIYVVDVGGFRRKRDGCVSQAPVGTSGELGFHRLRINIKDLALDKVPELNDGLRTLIGMGKHLCGACTDFALSCLTRRVPHKMPCSAVVIATCCHHLCELRHMNIVEGTMLPPTAPNATSTAGGVSFHGETFSEEEFKAIVSMTSWAVCGAHMVDEKRREVGWCCKRLLDALRMEYLEQCCGMNHVELHEYVDSSITRENICIVAWSDSDHEPAPSEA